MARTTLPIEAAPGPGTPLVQNVLAFTAADVANGNQFVHTGREIVIARNTGAGARTVTVQSVAVSGRQDPEHNIAQSIAAGAFWLFGPFGKGWQQDDGFVYINGEHAEVTFCVIRVP